MIKDNHYLKSSAMKATSSTMALASSVLGFEIIELWSDEGNDRYHCTYIHAEEELIQKFPDLIVGHYPYHKKKEHKISPMVSIILCHLFCYFFL